MENSIQQVYSRIVI